MKPKPYRQNLTVLFSAIKKSLTLATTHSTHACENRHFLTVHNVTTSTRMAPMPSGCFCISRPITPAPAQYILWGCRHLGEFWEMAKRFDRSFYREWQEDETSEVMTNTLSAIFIVKCMYRRASSNTPQSSPLEYPLHRNIV